MNHGNLSRAEKSHMLHLRRMGERRRKSPLIQHSALKLALRYLEYLKFFSSRLAGEKLVFFCEDGEKSLSKTLL